MDQMTKLVEDILHPVSPRIPPFQIPLTFPSRLGAALSADLPTPVSYLVLLALVLVSALPRGIEPLEWRDGVGTGYEFLA